MIFGKPRSGVRIARHLPICNGLCGTYLFNEMGGSRVYDIDGRMGHLNFVTSGSDPAWSSLGLSVGNGKGYAEGNGTIVSPFNPVSSDCTIRIIHRPDLWNSNYTCLVEAYAPGVGSSRIWDIFTNGSQISYRGIGGNDGGSSIATDMPVNVISDLIWIRKVNDPVGGGGPTGQTHYWYLNGKLTGIEQGFPTGVAASWPTTGYKLSLGGNPSGGGGVYNGTYIKAQMWHRALTPNEIVWAYTHPFGDIAKSRKQEYAASSVTTFLISINDKLAQPDNILRTVLWRRPNNSDSLGFQNITSRLANAKRTTLDNLGFQDVVSRLVNARRIVSDLLAINDYATTLASILRTVYETIGITDNISRTSDAKRVISDLFELIDTIEATKTGSLVTRQVNYFRALIDTIKVPSGQINSPQITRQVDTFRSILDSTGLVANDVQVTRLALIYRTILESIGLTDIVVDYLVIARSIVESFGLQDSTSRLAFIKRLVTDNIKMPELEKITSEVNRKIQDSIGLFDDTDFVDVIGGAIAFGLFADPTLSVYFEGSL